MKESLMNSIESAPMNTSETEQPTAVIECIAPNGLGFGHGGISVAEQIKQGILTPEAPARVNDFLMNDTEAFKPVQFDDDGCGDGRPWSRVEQIVTENGETKLRIFSESRRRAKVFGGGLVVASSMFRAIKGVPDGEATVGQDRAYMAARFQERDFHHGAHTDDHAEGESCGCGAINNYQAVTGDAIRYREGITNALHAVYGDEFGSNQSSIEHVFVLYEYLAQNQQYFVDGNGEQSMQQIKNTGAVVKVLSGKHVEETIVINEVSGTTLDQPYFTQEVKNACVEKPQTIQAFSVDAWRGRDIAQITTDIVAEQDPTIDRELTYKLAMADFWIRTLAVAGTLTAGDLPVYRRRAA